MENLGGGYPSGVGKSFYVEESNSVDKKETLLISLSLGISVDWMPRSAPGKRTKSSHITMPGGRVLQEVLSIGANLMVHGTW